MERAHRGLLHRGLLRRGYGAGPSHLLAVVVCLAVTAGAVAIVAGDSAWPRMLAWFLAAVLLHDFVLFPLYAAGDRLLTAVRPRDGRRRSRPAVPIVNHVRVPLLGAGLTFLLFLPGILGQGEPALRAASGLDSAPVAGRWLLLVAAMVAASALVYLVRVLRARLRRGPGLRGEEPVRARGAEQAVRAEAQPEDHPPCHPAESATADRTSRSSNCG